jgi:hypothetical protein
MNDTTQACNSNGMAKNKMPMKKLRMAFAGLLFEASIIENGTAIISVATAKARYCFRVIAKSKVANSGTPNHGTTFISHETILK